MVDIFDRATRSRMMAAIRSRDTKPEVAVRRYLHGMGFRFRLSPKSLIGKPDIVLAKYKVIIFVHGCFWHCHANCRIANTPQSNKQFWKAKFEANVVRDKYVTARLRREGWRVIVVWECQINEKKLNSVINRIKSNKSE